MEDWNQGTEIDLTEWFEDMLNDERETVWEIAEDIKDCKRLEVI